MFYLLLYIITHNVRDITGLRDDPYYLCTGREQLIQTRLIRSST